MTEFLGRLLEAEPVRALAEYLSSLALYDQPDRHEWRAAKGDLALAYLRALQMPAIRHYALSRDPATGRAQLALIPRLDQRGRHLLDLPLFVYEVRCRATSLDAGLSARSTSGTRRRRGC
jgi:hypothetical protein